MGTFVKVAEVGSIPENEGIVATIKGRQIAVFNQGGNYYATDDTCPHQGGSLGQGDIEGDDVVCPWHDWKFNIKTGDSHEIPGYKIDTITVKVEGKDILLEVTWV